MSPPASNEQAQDVQLSALGGVSMRQPHYSRPGSSRGPPSVDFIYPTPPSAEPFHHMSPENNQPGLCVVQLAVG